MFVLTAALGEGETKPDEVAGAEVLVVTGAGGGRVHEGRLSFDDVQPTGTGQAGPVGVWPGGRVATCVAKDSWALSCDWL